MKFAKIVGYKTTPETDVIVKETEDKLSSAFSELSLAYDNRSYGSKLGGDVSFCRSLRHTNMYVIFLFFI